MTLRENPPQNRTWSFYWKHSKAVAHGQLGNGPLSAQHKHRTHTPTRTHTERLPLLPLPSVTMKYWCSCSCSHTHAHISTLYHAQHAYTLSDTPLHTLPASHLTRDEEDAMSVGGGGVFHLDWKKEKLAFCQAAGWFFLLFNLINLMTND